VAEQPASEAVGWAIVELMGHRRLAGYVTEQEFAGTKLLRLDIYEGPEPQTLQEAEAAKPTATQFYGGSAIYCITPTTEETARAVAAARTHEPVQRWQLPAPAAATGSVEDSDDAFEELD
jgi:hypothetical protein